MAYAKTRNADSHLSTSLTISFTITKIIAKVNDDEMISNRYHQLTTWQHLTAQYIVTQLGSQINNTQKQIGSRKKVREDPLLHGRILLLKTIPIAG